MKYKKLSIFLLIITMVVATGCNKKQGYAVKGQDVADTFPLKAETVKENPQMAESEGPYAIFHTTAGDISVILYPNEAPEAVENFIALVESGFYNNSKIHFIKRGEIVQGGRSEDQKSEDETSEDEKLEDETSEDGTSENETSEDENSKNNVVEPFMEEFSDDLHNFHGALAMASSGIGTVESQFYFVANEQPAESEQVIPAQLYLNELLREKTMEINERTLKETVSEEEVTALESEVNEQLQNINEDGVPEAYAKRYETAVKKYMEVGGSFQLDYKNTVFGQVTKGLNIVDAMSKVMVNIEDRSPKQDIVIESIEIVEQLK